MKILLVDDDDIALAVASKVLKSDRHEVLLAEDGDEALEILRRNNIQLVITDWNMPNLNGLELCKYIRANSSGGYIYVVIVTSRNRKEDLIEGYSAGADDFISKPFEPVELMLRVRNAERIMRLDITDAALMALAKLAAEKDLETGQHLERMRNYSRLLAEQLLSMPEFKEEVPPKFADLIYQTSHLHDIGKVGIPDVILLKPDSLNDTEWLVMKQHTVIGANTLNVPIAQFPHAEFFQLARDIIWAHHERWDGTGYPRGLGGTDIPLSARIVALADVYDALTVKRVYKAAVSHDIAYRIIIEASGKHFDPQVVEAFKAVAPQFVEICARLGEN